MKNSKLFITASNFQDIVIVNPNAQYGKKITQICSYFYEQNENNPNPSVGEMLDAIRPHFKGDENYSHIEIGGVNYGI